MKLKQGDKVVMHTCGEAEHYNGKIWTCRTDQYEASSGSQVVFLEGFSGYFLAEYLQIVHLENVEKEIKPTECYQCDGKGVGLDWGAMTFWECDVCKGTGELED
ncbi:hypothetical protein OCF62_07435 [Bacillus wiedmannii]|uniref:hypothetical protein n=1 Tax=Bacillus wiedmannii TaxID=1890302 RepID=UPI0021D01F2C|nr:hypothetical protein [Bacillus wiedmannii]MCU5514402.1 hypothetical protein [Bacillus wiedmannii]